MCSVYEGIANECCAQFSRPLPVVLDHWTGQRDTHSDTLSGWESRTATSGGSCSLTTLYSQVHVSPYLQTSCAPVTAAFFCIFCANFQTCTCAQHDTLRGIMMTATRGTRRHGLACALFAATGLALQWTEACVFHRSRPCPMLEPDTDCQMHRGNQEGKTDNHSLLALVGQSRSAQTIDSFGLE